MAAEWTHAVIRYMDTPSKTDVVFTINIFKDKIKNSEPVKFKDANDFEPDKWYYIRYLNFYCETCPKDVVCTKKAKGVIMGLYSKINS